ncbi:MAG TPA: ATP-binding protein [Anaerolineales bacterium]
MFHSIRWRIATPYVLLIILFMAGLGIYLSSFVRQTYLNDLEDKLSTEARLVSELASPLLTSSPDVQAIDTLAKQQAALMGTRVTIIGPDGTVFGESHDDPTRMENHLNRPEILQARAQGQGSSTRYSETVKYNMMYTAVSVLKNGSLVGFVRISLPLQQIEANVNHLNNTLIGATLLAMLIAVFLATWIASRTTQPLRELTEAARQISNGDLEGRIIPTTSDEVGQLTHAFNTMAEQLRSQIEALESERSKMAAVLQEMTDGVLIANRQGQLQLVNPAAEKMFGILSEHALGHSIAEVLRHHQLMELWRNCQTSGKTQVAVIEINAKGLYLQGVATPLGKALPGSTLLLFQNLTRLRQLETIRRDFISNISHELRTPLASLKALTETLQEGAMEDPPAAQRFLDRMETEVDALSLMVSELVELSRIESGKVPLQLEAISPCNLLDRAVDRLRLQAERAGLMLNVSCAQDLPPVLADQNRMEQVIVNLLHNAIKFTPAGGEIRASAVQQDNQIVISVSDTGIGIPAGDLPRIFERFFKADRARSGGGTGLGLAIARHLVEAHHGRIWAESVEGKGSIFYFTLPLAQGREQEE